MRVERLAVSPKDCFDTALEAARIALQYMTPVVLLSDGYIANEGSLEALLRSADTWTVHADGHVS